MISFAEPRALLGLLALAPVLAAAAYAVTRVREADDALGGDEALRRGRSRSRARLRMVLLVVAVALIAIAAARPRWGVSDQPVVRRGIDVAIALDISRSMTATDLAPTRAAVAAAGLTDMLNHLRGDRVGLVTFAGSAFIRSPLTLDLYAVKQLVQQAQGEAALVRAGTDIGVALANALGLLDIDDPAETQVIVLVSDGEMPAGGELDGVLRRAANAGVRIYVGAAGTEGGADIPSDTAGNTERSSLDRDALALVARETGGDLRDVESIAGLAVEFARLRQSEFAAADRPAPVERFQWFLGLALVALVAQSLVAEGGRPAPLRVGRISLASATLLTLALVVACGGSSAYRHVRNGNEAYNDGRYDDALASYRSAADEAPDDPVVAYDIGNALHELRRFEEATVASSAAAAETEDSALLQSATYALGSHAFRRTALEEARDAFIGVLLRDPGDDDARYNLELVLLALAPPPETQNADGGDDGSGVDEGDDGESQDDGDGGSGATPSGEGESAGGGQGEPPDADAGGDTSGSGPAEAGAGEESGGLDQARQALLRALEGFGEEVTLAEALRILDLVREVNTFAPLESSSGRGGLLPPR